MASGSVFRMREMCDFAGACISDMVSEKETLVNNKAQV